MRDAAQLLLKDIFLVPTGAPISLFGYLVTA